MSFISYVNGHYIPHHKAMVHIEDRGYQFADGVYEVIPCYRKHLVDMDKHCIRLQQSLDGLQIDKTVSLQSLTIIIDELLRRNRLDDAYIYLQITRGVAKRFHAFPSKPITPSLCIVTSMAPGLDEKPLLSPQKAITQPDIRWQYCHIKSISLLPNVLTKQKAVEADALETILINDDNIITEGTSSNIFIVDANNTLITHPITSAILGGITRDNIITLAKEHHVTVDERPFTLEEAHNAKEVFISSTTKDIVPLGEIDDKVIGDGKTGEMTRSLHSYYINYMKGQIA